MDTKRKKKSLSFAEKQKVIKEVKKGLRLKKDIAAEFGIPTSTLSTILKSEYRIMETTSKATDKRKREAKFPDVEECLVTWSQQCRNNSSRGGPILKEKAEMFAKLLGHDDFKASNGWLDKFRKRSGLTFQKVSGESASVGRDVYSVWKTELRELLKDYDPSDIFNADEAALFYKCLPDKTANFRDEKCHGGEHGKERITVLLATNMRGTEKLKPLLIGKFKKPRCLAGCKSLPVDYSANKKAWMNAELFGEWLATIDRKMKREKRKIILFIDSCTAHNAIPPLESVRVKFLLRNTVLKLQPLDAGIIKTFKTLYRKEVVRKIILDMEDGKPSSINMLHVLRMVHKSWSNVDQKTIVNSFKTCGFMFGAECELEAEDEELEALAMHNIEAEWNTVVSYFNAGNTSFEDFVNFDNDVAVMGSMTDMEIVESVSQPQNDELDDSDDEEEPSAEPPVLAKEARSALDTLRTFLEASTGVPDSVFAAIVKLENEIEMQTIYTLQQPAFTDLFTVCYGQPQ